ncbi:MAG: hypothetical protein ACI89E_002057, partial [Planctomycetota bacterium]
GRGTTSDGRFRLWMGGMEQFEESPAQSIELGHDPAELEWMKPEKLKALFTWPTTINIKSARLKNGLVSVVCDVEGMGTLTQARLYLGAKDGLTLAERWDQALVLSGLQEGEAIIQLDAPTTARFARILVENEHGKFWSMKTVPITVE